MPFLEVFGNQIRLGSVVWCSCIILPHLKIFMIPNHVSDCCISSTSIFFDLLSPHVSLSFSSRSTVSYNWASTDTSQALLLWLKILASQFTSSISSWASSTRLVVAHLLISPSTILPTIAVVELSHNFYATTTRSCSYVGNLSRALIPLDKYWLWGLHIRPSDGSNPMWACGLCAHEIHLPT